MNKGFDYNTEDIYISNNNLTYTEIENIKKEINEIKSKLAKNNLTPSQKGNLFEEYIEKILKLNEKDIKISKNVRTSDNELDFYLKLTLDAKMKRSREIIPSYIPDHIIFECKNYNEKLPITYINKFYSILIAKSYKMGILLSYNGITGEDKVGWSEGAGFIKKINLLALHYQELSCIENKMCPLKKKYPYLCYVNKDKIKNLENENYNLFEWIDDLVEETKVDVLMDFSNSHS